MLNGEWTPSGIKLLPPKLKLKTSNPGVTGVCLCVCVHPQEHVRGKEGTNDQCQLNWYH